MAPLDEDNGGGAEDGDGPNQQQERRDHAEDPAYTVYQVLNLLQTVVDRCLLKGGRCSVRSSTSHWRSERLSFSFPNVRVLRQVATSSYKSLTQGNYYDYY